MKPKKKEPRQMVQAGRNIFFLPILIGSFFLTIIELIGRVTIITSLLIFNSLHFVIWSTFDAFFFLLYLVIRFCEGLGGWVLRLPFIAASLVFTLVVLVPIAVGRKTKELVLDPVVSVLLGVPTIAIKAKQSKLAAESKTAKSGRFAFFQSSLAFVPRFGRVTISIYTSTIDNYRLFRRHHMLAFAISGGTILTLPVIAVACYFTVLKDLPSPTLLRSQQQALTTRIFDRKGRLLYKIYRNTNRTFIPLSEIPLPVRQATIAIEDHDFYQHHGISLRGIMRAFVANYTHKEVQQGASTITQQLVRNRFLTSERTVERKFKEVALALVTEMIYSKDEILEMYLNTVPYGGTAYGVEEASETYFNKNARDLDLAEAALLAGLTSAPSAFSPHGSSPELARMRQKQTIKNMVQLGFITQTQADVTLAEEVAIVPPNIPIFAPHWVMYVRQYLVDHFGQKMVEEGGLQVTTTLDLDIQQEAEKIVAKEHQDLKTHYDANNAAAMVTNPRTGEILGYVASADYWDKSIKGNVDILQSEQQPGSSIKVVNYSYALGHGFTPSTIINDSPVVYRVAGSEAYAPKNYDGKFHGQVTIRQALGNSFNIPAVKVLATYGPQKMVEMGQRMGIASWDGLKNYGLSITLGAAEVKPAEMAVVYGVFANSGVRRDLTPIKEITDAAGRHVDLPNKPMVAGVIESVEAQEKMPSPSPSSRDGETVLSPSVAYWITDILSDDKARLMAFGRYAKLSVPGHKVAVKTGTSNNYMDNWTIGYTPDYLVVTWVGNTDNKPMNHLTSGITGAAPIWNAIMTELLKDTPNKDFDKPSGLVPVKICASTGTLACQYCKDVVTEYYIPGTEPKRACNISSPDECAKRKSQAESEGKSPDEVAKIVADCILPTAPPSP